MAAESQKVENTEKTDEAVKNEETEVEGTTETVKQDVESRNETTMSSAKTETDSSIIESFDYSNYDVPINNTIKSYMDYRRITSTSSKQYRLQHSLAYTGDYGIRMVNGRYCIAVGSYYTTTIGQYIDIELENGNIIKAILADCKDDAHTDSTNRINPNGSVIEFVVDVNVLDDTVKVTGDVSNINGWDSKVVNIKVYDKVEEY